jgi:tetratricopeptide (TPR) repeat protein
VTAQRIGITDVTITYHRPLVSGRAIWGKTVPYGEVWRAGANENTTIEFTDPVTIAGRPLPKGIYGLHMIPGENEWTIIFSKAYTSWGSFTYDQNEDALRVTAKPQPGDFHEALAYDFDALKPNSALITLRWEKLAVPFEVSVDVEKTVEASLPAQLRGWPGYTWDAWDDAATYLLENKGNLKDALKYEERSIQTEERFENLITKSRILDAMEKRQEATTVRSTAMGQGSVVQLHTYGRFLQNQGKQEQAFEIFRMNVQKNPDNWLVHSEIARMDCAKGDYDNAIKQMKLSVDGAPDNAKPFMQAMVRRLQGKEDINK